MEEVPEVESHLIQSINLNRPSNPLKEKFISTCQSFIKESVKFYPVMSKDKSFMTIITYNKDLIFNVHFEPPRVESIQFKEKLNPSSYLQIDIDSLGRFWVMGELNQVHCFDQPTMTLLKTFVLKQNFNNCHVIRTLRKSRYTVAFCLDLFFADTSQQSVENIRWNRIIKEESISGSLLGSSNLCGIGNWCFYATDRGHKSSIILARDLKSHKLIKIVKFDDLVRLQAHEKYTDTKAAFNGMDCSDTHLFVNLQTCFIVYDVMRIQKRDLNALTHIVNVEHTQYSMNLYRCTYVEDLDMVILGDYYRKSYTAIDVKDPKNPHKLDNFVRTGNNDHLLHISYVKALDLFIAVGNNSKIELY